MDKAAHYWGLVAQTRSHLNEVNYLTSIEDPLTGQVGGKVCGASREVAAECIVKRSHRLSTEEEILQFHAEIKERDRLCAENEFRKRQEKGGTVTILDQETAIRLGALPPPQVDGPSRKARA